MTEFHGVNSQETQDQIYISQQLRLRVSWKLRWGEISYYSEL